MDFIHDPVVLQYLVPSEYLISLTLEVITWCFYSSFDLELWNKLHSFTKRKEISAQWVLNSFFPLYFFSFSSFYPEGLVIKVCGWRININIS